MVTFSEWLTSADSKDIEKEVVVPKSGQPHQAGSSHSGGAFIDRLRSSCEKSLFVFGKAVMQRSYFTKHLHLPICEFLQKTPPHRKMLLIPRDHAKTSIVSHCLPPHILIQPAESNIYFPGLEGSEMRILLSGESATRAESNLRVIRTAFESNQLLKALWPQRCWEAPRRQAKKWSDQALIIPRESEYPDPSVWAIGVGGAITGARPTVIIKDDLVSLEAANSDVVMRSAIEWHVASRALMDEYEKDSGLESLEFIIGTRWAVFDLYEYVLSGDGEVGPDHSVEVLIRKILEDGEPIWPERFTQKRIDQLRREFGSRFFLLYMNEAMDPALVDFDMTMVRQFTYSNDFISYDTDYRDEELITREAEPLTKPDVGQNMILPANADTFNRLFGEGRAKYLRLKRE